MKKSLEYQDEKGNVLYGFSQSNLDRTNARLSDIAFSLKLLIILVVLLLIGILVFVGWLGYNDIITRIIYGY